MKNSRFPKLSRFCFFLVKIFCGVFAAILVLCLLCGVFGAPAWSMLLLTTTFPWLLRSMICIGCALTLTSLSESL